MKSHVGMLHRICPVCSETVNTDILVDTKLRESLEKDNYTFADHLCDSCSKQRETHVPLVEVSNSGKQSTLKPQDAIRTGRFAFLRIPVFCDIFNQEPPTVPLVFCDTELMDKLISIAPPQE